MFLNRRIKKPAKFLQKLYRRNNFFLSFLPSVFTVISLLSDLFVAIEPAGFSAGGFGSGLIGLESWSDNKKKAQVESVYFRSSSYKKAKKPEVVVGIVDLLAGPLSTVLLHLGVDNQKVSWGSKVKNEESSISKMLDIENLRNTVAEKMSYVDFNVSETDDIMDNATSKKIDNDTELVLPAPKFDRSNQLLSTKSHPVKLYALDIKLLSVPRKTNGDKLVSLSLKRARKLAIHEKFVANNDVRHVNKISDQVIVVKKIPVDLPKSVVESVFSKFGKIVSIKMQLIGLWQKALVEFELSEIADLNSVCVAKAIDDKQLWVFRDLHQALLYTLPVGTMAHDFSNLLESYDEKTCFIGCNPSSYVCNRCAVMCFSNKTSKLAAIGSILVYKSMNLYWAGLSLALCAHCKQFGHISTECSLGGSSGARANIYKKKQALITCPVSFGGKTWAQVAGGSLSCVVFLVSSGASVSSDGKPLSLVSSPPDVSGLSDCLMALECSLELLADQVSDILRKLNGVELVPLAPLSCVSLPAVTVPKVSVSNLDMLVDSVLASSESLPSIVNVSDAGFSSSVSKVLTTKVGGLESKLLALDASVGTVLTRLDLLCAGAGSLLP
ncbi:hypothetical protein G9A89_007293 [Geosiphon pyriformis]|nr:hypothetical protein G9A89_007293 [Geosiphon pyriformis]